MAFTDALDVSIGAATRASDYDNLADNTEFNREKTNAEHDLDISTGAGKHKSISFLNSADVIALKAGTASLPSLTAEGDLNTGLYFPAADKIGLVVAGVEVMTIHSNGDVTIGTTSDIATMGSETAAPAGIALRGNAAHASFTGTISYLEAVRAASSSFTFAADYANSSSDLVYKRTGAGVVTADGSFTGGGADVASLFESVDGSAIPVGTTVVLEDGKVRPATEDDSPAQIIGAVRPDDESVSLLMNSAPHKWSKKYLKDDFDAYVLNEAQERIINPEYDEEAEYIPRKDRSEWIIIGLLDQVPIKKGQPVGDRWLKMKDVSEDVELWFIR